MLIFPCEFIIGSGCRVSTNRGMINTKNGTVTAAIIEYTDESYAHCSPESMAERSAKYAPYIISSINMEVCLGSQFQKDPQLNFAQRDPVAVASMQNKNPRPAKEKDLMS